MLLNDYFIYFVLINLAVFSLIESENWEIKNSSFLLTLWY